MLSKTHLAILLPASSSPKTYLALLVLLHAAHPNVEPPGPSPPCPHPAPSNATPYQKLLTVSLFMNGLCHDAIRVPAIRDQIRQTYRQKDKVKKNSLAVLPIFSSPVYSQARQGRVWGNLSSLPPSSPAPNPSTSLPHLSMVPLPATHCLLPLQRPTLRPPPSHQRLRSINEARR